MDILQVKRLTTENVSLKMAAQSAQEALRAELDRSPPAEQRHVSSPARDKHTTHDSLVGGLASADDANMTVEEQEMSFAVAACEPDVSQLMEDIEVIYLKNIGILIYLLLRCCLCTLWLLLYRLCQRKKTTCSRRSNRRRIR